jgi:16S rRNA (cytidine1402-2'-O)-methyltransferase
MLYLIATPIGNLADISYRAVETLKNCDYLLCEDTRHSMTLLKSYGIQKPLKSFHKFNEAEKEEEILLDLKSGKKISLLSDAGTPAISDPGRALIARCRKEKIAISALPGPCALLLALLLSGFETQPFQFVGFLPKKNGELTRTLQVILFYPGTSIAYESPHRLLNTLAFLATLAPTRTLSIGRELTKSFEESLNGTARELLDHFTLHPPKGELVLLIAKDHSEENLSDLSIKTQVELMQEKYGVSLKEAIKAVAEITNRPKSAIYNEFHQQH